MGFFKTVKSSIYSPEFYKGVSQRSLFSAILYFLLLSVLVTIIQSINPVVSFVTVGEKEVQKFVSSMVNSYPQELEVKIQNGKVTSNVKEPYFIPIPEYMTSGTSAEYKNIAIIDTKTPFSASQFNTYKTLSWVSSDTVFILGDNKGQIRTVDLSKTSDFIINKKIVNSFVEKFSPFLKLLTPIVVVSVFFGILFLHLLRFVYLFFLALLLKLLFNLLKQPKSYGESYKIGLYAMTAGTLFELLIGFIKFPGIPLAFTVITIIIVAINFPSSKKPVKSVKGA